MLAPDTSVVRSRNRIDAMRLKMGLNPPAPEQAWWQTALSGIGDTVSREFSMEGVGGALARSFNTMFGGIPQIANTVGMASAAAQGQRFEDPLTSGDRSTSLAQIGAGFAAPLAGAMVAYDTGIRGLNTAVGGSALLGSALYQARIPGVQANPLFRDGYQLSDIPETYKMVWGKEEVVKDDAGNPVIDPETGKPQTRLNAITAGQALALTIGRTWTNTVDLLTPGDLQKQINEYILEDTGRALADPTNERGLYSWMSGLYSEFDVSNYQERESAFNQGLGRWISGASDAAIQWYLAPDVIGLKVAGKAGRSLFMQSIDDFGDVAKLEANLKLHAAYLAGDPAGKKTAVGKLAESLMRMDEGVVSKHKIATTSTDQTLVARALGRAKTFDEVSDVLMAFSGNKGAIDRLIDTDVIVGDLLKAKAAERAAQVELLTYAQKTPEEIAAFGPAAGWQLQQRILGAPDEIARIDKVLEVAVKEDEKLATVLAGINKEAGFADNVLFDNIQLSKLNYGPNSVGRLARQAQKEYARSAGTSVWNHTVFKAGGVGRPIRVIRSGVDLMKTHRIRGYARLVSSNDAVAELDASMQTLPMFRKLARGGTDTPLYQGSKITVAQFRQEMMDKMVAATNATQRRDVFAEYEARVWNALARNYNLDPDVARDVLAQYSGLRQGLREQIISKGWFKDGDEVVVTPDLQSMLAETWQTMDFHFVEQIFRIESGSGLARARVYGDKSLDYLNSLWRPLVLMRLGYTMRNVSEGWLRELSIYGTFGPLVGRNMATTGLSQSDKAFIRWAHGVRGGVERVTNLRYGRIKKLRRQVDAAASVNKERARAARNAARNYEEHLGTIDAYHESALRDAEKVMTSELVDRFADAAGPVPEMVDDLARGRMTDIFDTVDEIWIRPENVRPFIHGGTSRRADVASGDRSLSNLQRRVASEGDDYYTIDARMYPDPSDTDGPYQFSTLMKYSASKDELQKLASKRSSTGLTADEEDRFNELVWESVQHRARAAMRQGDHVLRWLPEEGRYQHLHSPMDIELEDVWSGNLALLLKEDLDKVQAIRANVAGGTLDLRKGEVEISETARNRLASLDPGQVDDWRNEDVQFVDELHGLLTGNLLESSARHPEDNYNDLRYALDLMDADPAIAEAIQLKLWADRLPAPIREHLEDKGLLIKNEELRRLLKSVPKEEDAYYTVKEAAQRMRDEMEQRFADDDFWLAYKEWGWHGGRKTQWRPMDINPNTVRGYVGPGRYTTDNGMVGSSYMMTKAFEDIATEGAGEPAIYIVKADPALKGRFIDLEEPVDNAETEEWILSLGNDVLDRLGIEGDFLDETGDLNSRVWQFIGEEDINNFTPVAPFAQPDGGGQRTVMDFMRAMLTAAGEAKAGADSAKGITDDILVDVWKAWTEAVTAQGAVGVKHLGGKNWLTYPNQRGMLDGEVQHTAYVWYDTTDMKMQRVKDLSDEAVALLELEQRAQAQLRKLNGQRRELSFHKNFAPYSNRTLDAEMMTPAMMQRLLGGPMKELGIGKILVHDSASPNGYRVIVNPDQMSIGTDSIDAVIPGSLKYGKDYSDRMWKASQEGAWADVLGDSAFYPRNLGRDQLLAALGGDEEAVGWLLGTVKKPSAEARARVVRYMEVNDLTHVAVGKEGKETYLAGHEILGKRPVGSAYGALLGKTDVEQRAQLVLQNDPHFQTLLRQEQELKQEADRTAQFFDEQTEKTKALSEKLAKRIGRRAQGEQIKNKLGTGTEYIPYRGGMIELDGPFNPNAEGSMWMELAGAGERVQADLYGFTDFTYRNMRRTGERVNYQPGNPLYWTEMADQANRLWRNDVIGQALAAGKTDDEIMDILFATKRGRSWLRNSPEFSVFKDYVSRETLTDGLRDDMVELIQSRRAVFERVFPDAEIRKHLVDHEVTADFLRTRMAWRGDLPTLEGFGMAHAHMGFYRTATGNIMHVLGTLPENALVRHPFYRARWREEMQRQANLYYDQGVTNFTNEQINAMNQVARKKALQQVNDTLYTIQRMSTPAHALRFVIPFFPAWASATKFWLGRVPVEKPENIARYAMAFSAPDNAGWMVDNETGEPVKPESQGTIAGFASNVAAKLSGAEDASINIQVTPAVAKALAPVLGGETNIKIGKGTLDMMLQGEYFWSPGLGPIITVPASWFAAQMPDLATALERGQITQGKIPELDSLISKTELGRALYRTAVPFGTPTKEKDFLSALADGVLPAGLQKFATALRGEGSPEFRNAAQAIYRDTLTDWELGGREGQEPSFLDAVSQARTFWLFRGLVNYVAPFAPGFQSKYQFYIDEWRRMEADAYDSGLGYREAQEQFISLYGPTFFRYTKSLSGSTSGMSATVGEFNAFKSDPEAMASLAQIGDDASYMTMLTRPFADQGREAFASAVYAYQTDRPVEGAPGKYIRGGNQAVASEVSSDKDLGWYYFRKGEEQWAAALTQLKLKNYDDAPALDQARQAWLAELGAQYPAWYDDYQDIGGNRWFQANQALDIVLQSKTYEQNADAPYFKALKSYQYYRDQFNKLLRLRDSQGGSDSLDATSNRDIALAWTDIINGLKAADPTGQFEDTYNRFFSSDKLKTMPRSSNG